MLNLFCRDYKSLLPWQSRTNWSNSSSSQSVPAIITYIEFQVTKETLSTPKTLWTKKLHLESPKQDRYCWYFFKWLYDQHNITLFRKIEYFTAIVLFSPLGMWSMDPNGRVMNCNSDTGIGEPRSNSKFITFT